MKSAKTFLTVYGHWAAFRLQLRHSNFVSFKNKIRFEKRYCLYNFVCLFLNIYSITNHMYILHSSIQCCRSGFVKDPHYVACRIRITNSDPHYVTCRIRITNSDRDQNLSSFYRNFKKKSERKLFKCFFKLIKRFNFSFLKSKLTTYIWLS